MASSTVRISTASREILREMAAWTGKSMRALLDQAIEHYRRDLFLERANTAFAALRRDPVEWNAEVAEREGWDVTLGDGLERD